jgi:hypothetical protein
MLKTPNRFLFWFSEDDGLRLLYRRRLESLRKCLMMMKGQANTQVRLADDIDTPAGPSDFGDTHGCCRRSPECTGLTHHSTSGSVRTPGCRTRQLLSLRL